MLRWRAIRWRMPRHAASLLDADAHTLHMLIMPRDCFSAIHYATPCCLLMLRHAAKRYAAMLIAPFVARHFDATFDYTFHVDADAAAARERREMHVTMTAVLRCALAHLCAALLRCAAWRPADLQRYAR